MRFAGPLVCTPAVPACVALVSSPNPCTDTPDSMPIPLSLRRTVGARVPSKLEVCRRVAFASCSGRASSRWFSNSSPIKNGLVKHVSYKDMAYGNPLGLPRLPIPALDDTVSRYLEVREASMFSVSSLLAPRWSAFPCVWHARRRNFKLQYNYYTTELIRADEAEEVRFCCLFHHLDCCTP